LQVYLRERVEAESFIDTVRRIGHAPFKEHVYATDFDVEEEEVIDKHVVLLRNIQCLIIPQGSNKMIIRNKAIIEDDWIVLRLGEQESAEDITVAAGKVIVPLKVWLRSAMHCSNVMK
jgi:hypothetical protein